MATHALVKWSTENDQVLIDKEPISNFDASDRAKGLIEGNVYTVRYSKDKKNTKHNC